jgi:hypothetical protein
MPVRIQVSEIVDRDVPTVFKFYANDHVQNHPRWDPDMKLEQLSDGPIGLGTVIRRENSHSGTLVEGRMTVTEFIPDRSMAVEIQDGSVRTIGRATFEPQDGDRTRITIYAEFPDIDDPSLELRLTPMIQRSARNIKKLIELETLHK